VQLVGLTVSKIVASASGASDSASNAAAIMAKLAVENNYLLHESDKMLRPSEQEEFATAHKECAGGTGPQAACTREVELDALSRKRDALLAIACDAEPGSAVCRGWIADARANGYVYDSRTNQFYLPKDGRSAVIDRWEYPGADIPEKKIAEGVKEGVEILVVDRAAASLTGWLALAGRGVLDAIIDSGARFNKWIGSAGNTAEKVVSGETKAVEVGAARTPSTAPSSTQSFSSGPSFLDGSTGFDDGWNISGSTLDRGFLPSAEKQAVEIGKVANKAVVPQNSTAYSVAFETKLNPADFGESRSVHFNRANAALDSALQFDAQFAKMMEELIPGLRPSVSSVGGRATPTGWTWEHASSSTAFGQQGVMRLVPTAQHTPGSSWWRVIHPDGGASGGYSEWAIPAGAPKN
jgi:hypothetical protein